VFRGGTRITMVFDAGLGGGCVAANGVSGAPEAGTGTGGYHPTQRGNAPPSWRKSAAWLGTYGSSLRSSSRGVSPTRTDP
jgi:hypothetical protein